MLLKRSAQYNLLVLKTVKALLSTSRADVTLANIAQADKIPGTIVYVQDTLQHVFWNGLLWTQLSSSGSSATVYLNYAYNAVFHYSGSELNSSITIPWTALKAQNGIPSSYYVSYPVVGHVFYLSGSMTSIYTSQSNTVVYQNGGNGGTTKPRTYNVWFTPQTSSGWVGTASIAIQYTVHQ